MKQMFPYFYRLFFSLVLPLFSLSVLEAAAERAVPLDDIVAVVNEDVVVRSELDSRVTQLVLELERQGTRLPSRDVLENQVLERLILTKLQLEVAARVGIVVNDDVLNEAVNNVAGNNGMSVEKLRETLESEGIQFPAFREEMRAQITISQLYRQQIMNAVRVSDQELDAYLAKNADGVNERSEYHIMHILIATPDGASPEEIREAQGRAERLVGKLRDGLDFKHAAVAESDGRQALEGGDLGWRNAAQLPTLFGDRLALMEREEISDPIRSSSGFHIIKLEDFKGGERHVITQTHSRHILVRTNEITSDQDARMRLAQLKQRIEGGDDFAILARSHSDDKASAIKGGDLGWTSPGDLVPQFEEQVGKLAPGRLSEPFRTPFGWHLVQLLERREHDSTEEFQKAKARNAIRERKAAEEGELFLRRLRDEAYVEIRLADY